MRLVVKGQSLTVCRNVRFIQFANFAAASEAGPQRVIASGGSRRKRTEETGRRVFAVVPNWLLQPGRSSTLVRNVRVWGIGGHQPSVVGLDGRGDRAAPGIAGRFNRPAGKWDDGGLPRNIVLLSGASMGISARARHPLHRSDLLTELHL